MKDIQSITYNSLDGEAGWHEFKAKAEELCSQNYEPYKVITNSQIVGSSETIEFRQTDVEWEFYSIHWLLDGEDAFDGVGHFMQEKQAEGWSLVGSIDRRAFLGQSLVPFLSDLLSKNKSVYFKRRKYSEKKNNDDIYVEDYNEPQSEKEFVPPILPDTSRKHELNAHLKRAARIKENLSAYDPNASTFENDFNELVNLSSEILSTDAREKALKALVVNLILKGLDGTDAKILGQNCLKYVSEDEHFYEHWMLATVAAWRLRQDILETFAIGKDHPIYQDRSYEISNILKILIDDIMIDALLVADSDEERSLLSAIQRNNSAIYDFEK